MNWCVRAEKENKEAVNNGKGDKVCNQNEMCKGSDVCSEDSDDLNNLELNISQEELNEEQEMIQGYYKQVIHGSDQETIEGSDQETIDGSDSEKREEMFNESEVASVAEKNEDKIHSIVPVLPVLDTDLNVDNVHTTEVSHDDEVQVICGKDIKKEEKIPHTKKDFGDLTIGKYTRETLEKALAEVRKGRTYASVAGEFHISTGTLSNWLNKDMKKTGSGPVQKVPNDIENLIADFVEETWLNLSPKFKTQIIDEINYYLSMSQNAAQMKNKVVTFTWLDGLQERKDKVDFISFVDAKTYSTKNCRDVADWTRIRKRHLEHLGEISLPLSSQQVIILDLIDLVSGGDPKIKFKVLVSYGGCGKILRLYLKDTDRFSQDDQDLCRKNFGLILEKNGQISGASMAVVVHDIER